MATVIRSDARQLDLADFDSGAVYVHFDGAGSEHLHSYANVGRFAYTHRHQGGNTPHEHADDPAVTQGRAFERGG